MAHSCRYTSRTAQSRLATGTDGLPLATRKQRERSRFPKPKPPPAKGEIYTPNTRARFSKTVDSIVEERLGQRTAYNEMIARVSKMRGSN